MAPPEGAVQASNRMFVIRSPEGEVGKFIADEGTAKIPLGGKECKINDFDFLVVNEGALSRWARVHDPPGPGMEPLVWAGPRMAVIRSTNRPDRDPGKYIADENAAKIPADGKEVRLAEGHFEFLVVSMAEHAVVLPPALPSERQWRVAPKVAGAGSESALGPLYTWELPTSVEGGIMVPAKAVKASERMFVIRSPEGEVGKFIADEGTAKIPLGGIEVRVEGDAFAFLVLGQDVQTTWTASPPDQCVWASSRMAVIRATDRADKDPGKYIADEDSAKIPFNGTEVSLKCGSFEFLGVTRAAGADELAEARQGAESLSLSQARAKAGEGAVAGASGSGSAIASSSDALLGELDQLVKDDAAHAALAQRGEALGSLVSKTASMAAEAEVVSWLVPQHDGVSTSCTSGGSSRGSHRSKFVEVE